MGKRKVPGVTHRGRPVFRITGAKGTGARFAAQKKNGQMEFISADFVKGKKGSTSKRSRSKKKRSKKRSRRRTRTKKKGRTMARKKPSISKIAALGIPQVVALGAAADAAQGGNIGAAAATYADELSKAYTGFSLADGSFDFRRAVVGWVPLIAAKAITIAKRALGNPSTGSLPVTI